MNEMNHDVAAREGVMTNTWGWDEASAFLGCTPGTLRVWVSRKKVPFTKVGRKVRFRPEHLDEFLEQNTVKPNQS